MTNPEDAPEAHCACCHEWEIRWAMRDDIVCPFCDDNSFDRIGLKAHLSLGMCESFNDTEVPNKKAQAEMDAGAKFR